MLAIATRKVILSLFLSLWAVGVIVSGGAGFGRTVGWLVAAIGDSPPMQDIASELGDPATDSPRLLAFVLPIGVVFSGAILGDHISPISDTSVLSATFTWADLVDHVRTQLYYAVTVMPVVAVLTLVWLHARQPGAPARRGDTGAHRTRVRSLDGRRQSTEPPPHANGRSAAGTPRRRLTEGLTGPADAGVGAVARAATSTR